MIQSCYKKDSIRFITFVQNYEIINNNFALWKWYEISAKFESYIAFNFSQIVFTLIQRIERNIKFK